MHIEEITHYSNCLDREMHMMIYGHGGVPFLAFPTQDSLCHNYEEFGMIRELSDYLENGQIQYFVVDTIDKESWSEGDWDKGRRAWKQELYFHYIVDEVMPFILERTGGKLPRAIYSDRSSCFFVNRGATLEEQLAGAEKAQTQWQKFINFPKGMVEAV